MANVVHVNFATRLATYTLDLYCEDLSIRVERLVAEGPSQAKCLAIQRAKALGNIRSLMLYEGRPSARQGADKAVLVMLREDIASYQRERVEPC